MPGIFADEKRCPAPPGIERLDAAAGFHEAFLVEHSIGREEYLPVNVTDSGIRPAQRSIQAGVIIAVAVDLVESQCNVERGGAGLLVLPAEVTEQLVGGHRQIPYPTLQEIACESGLGPD
jgi:hypothetical protein